MAASHEPQAPAGGKQGPAYDAIVIGAGMSGI